MMRYSLTTLVLVAFWIAALMLVWARREPWHFFGRDQKRPDLVRENLHRSPDGSRLAEPGAGTVHICRNFDIHSAIELHKMAPVPPLFIIETPEFDESRQLPDDWYETIFLNDDELLVQSCSDAKAYFLFHRRFPEWWWGHFYRPEVWLALALTGVLFWRGIRARRELVAAPPEKVSA